VVAINLLQQQLSNKFSGESVCFIQVFAESSLVANQKVSRRSAIIRGHRKDTVTFGERFAKLQLCLPTSWTPESARALRHDDRIVAYLDGNFPRGSKSNLTGVSVPA
jgi:hypothetical protein